MFNAKYIAINTTIHSISTDATTFIYTPYFMDSAIVTTLT